MNIDEFIERQQNLEKMLRNPVIDIIQRNDRMLAQIANSNWLNRVNEIQNIFSRMNISSHINQLNRVSVQPLEIISNNKATFDQMRAIHNKIENLLPDITSYYADAEEITDSDVDEFESDYHTLLEELESLKNHSLSEEQRIEMSSSLKVILEELDTSSEVFNAEDYSAQNQSDRESYAILQQNQYSKYSVFNSLQSVYSRLSDPNWHDEKLTEFITNKFYEIIYALGLAVTTGKLDVVVFGFIIIVLLSMFRKGSKD